jgi:hypothetical protein
MIRNNYVCEKSKCQKSGCQNYGSSNRSKYDSCEYEKSLMESVAPLSYMLYDGKFENCEKCIYDNKFYRRYDLVDAESEILNITRPNTKCPQGKYNPFCKKSPNCWSTFDSSMPIAPVPDICPIVFNNIKKMKTPGYNVPNSEICNRNIRFRRE